MHHIVNSREHRKLVEMANAGVTAKTIAYRLKLNLDRVEALMPKDPEVAAAEEEARAKARAKTKAAQEAKADKMELNKGKKKRAKAKATAS